METFYLYLYNFPKLYLYNFGKLCFHFIYICIILENYTNINMYNFPKLFTSYPEVFMVSLSPTIQITLDSI
jgi:hypothetical protein